MRTALALIVLAAAVIAAGCGGNPEVSHGDDLAAGKALFLNGTGEADAPPTCGACHTLSDAGPRAQGKIGPNLDDAFGPARAQNFALSTFEQVVREQMEIPGTPTDVAIDNVDGESRVAMPSRDDYGFTNQEANNIAFYVATCSGLVFLPEDDPATDSAKALCAAVSSPETPSAEQLPADGG